MKKILFILISIITANMYGQDSVKVSELTATTSLDSADIFYVIDGGTSKKVLWYYMAQTGFPVDVRTNSAGSATHESFSLGEGSFANVLSSAYSDYGIGAGVFNSLTVGDGNSGFGFNAGNKLVSGSANFFGGYYNSYFATTADYTSSIGAFTLNGLTTGDYNSALGGYAGYSNADADSNLYLGFGAGYHNTNSGEMFIANDPDDTLIWADFSEDTVVIYGDLYVTGDHNLGTTYTFTNGLTESSGTIKLGGSLTEATTINSGAYALDYTGTGAITFTGGLFNFETDNDQFNFNRDGIGTYLSIIPQGNMNAVFVSSNLTNDLRIRAGSTTTTPGDLSLSAGNNTAAGSDGDIYIGYDSAASAVRRADSIFFGNGKNAISLNAKGSETNIIYFNTTTGLITYGSVESPLNSGSGITIDVSENVDLGGTLDGDAQIGGNGVDDIYLGTSGSNLDNLWIYTDNGVSVNSGGNVVITANNIGLTSGGNLIIDGTITGKTEIRLNTAASVVLTADSCLNIVHVNWDADAIDYTLPAAEQGLSVMFIDKAGGVITVDPAAGDIICLNGTDLAAGNSIDSPGDAGNQIVLTALDGTYWMTTGRSGVWIDGGP